MFRTKIAENSKHTFHVQKLFFFNRAAYEMMWKNMVERDRPQLTIWRMRSECWVTKATYTHSQYVILIVFSLEQWLHAGA